MPSFPEHRNKKRPAAPASQRESSKHLKPSANIFVCSHIANVTLFTLYAATHHMTVTVAGQSEETVVVYVLLS